MEKNSAITLRKHKAGQAPEGNDALQLSDPMRSIRGAIIAS